jgi:hypothetical protein
MSEIKGYHPDDAIAICGDESKRQYANLNQSAGPAYSLFLGSKLLGCGGVRIYGIGEAWCMFTDDAIKNNKKTILRASQEQMEIMVRENKLWRLFAETKVNENFLEHLGFKKATILVR